jgi:hypothetical protein
LVQIRAIQQRVHSFASPLATQQQIETAIEILALTKTPTMLSASHVSNIMNTPFVHEEEVLRVSVSTVDDDNAFFCLPDDPTVALSLIACYLENHLLLGGGECSKEKTDIVEYLLRTSLSLSLLISDIASRAVHRIHALALNIIAGGFQHSMPKEDLLQELMTWHEGAEYSAQLIGTYGIDLMPLTLALNSQQFIFASDWRRGVEFVNLAVIALRKVKHLASITLAIFPICSVLVLMQRFDQALSVFNEYLLLLRAHPVDTVLEGVSRVTFEWLTRLNRHEMTSRISTGRVASSKLMVQTFQDDSDVDHIMLHSDVALQDPGQNPPALYQFLRRHARSIEGMFAEMCAVKLTSLEVVHSGPVSCFVTAMLTNVVASLSAHGQVVVSFGAISSILSVLNLLEDVPSAATPTSVSSIVSDDGLVGYSLQVKLAIKEQLTIGADAQAGDEFLSAIDRMKALVRSELSL